MILLRISKIRDEISSIIAPAIFKMFMCGVSRVVACICHDSVRYLLHLTLKVYPINEMNKGQESLLLIHL